MVDRGREKEGRRELEAVRCSLAASSSSPFLLSHSLERGSFILAREEVSTIVAW